jgi:hypothetical protein
MDIFRSFFEFFLELAACYFLKSLIYPLVHISTDIVNQNIKLGVNPGIINKRHNLFVLPLGFVSIDSLIGIAYN